MSIIDCENEKKIIDNDRELSIFYSDKERNDMAVQMNTSYLWLYSDVMWNQTVVTINFQNILNF